MKLKGKKSSKQTLSDKIADALTVKPRPDIEDDQEFGTKPTTLSRVDFSASDSEEDHTITDFRKRNVNLLSDISKKYEGKVVSKEDLEESDDLSKDELSEGGNDLESLAKYFAKKNSTSKSESSTEADKTPSETNELDYEDVESDDYSITRKVGKNDGYSYEENSEDEEDDASDGVEEEGEGLDISEMDQPPKEDFEHMKKQNTSEEVKKGASVRSQLLVWESLLEMRIHLQRCLNTANQMPLPELHHELRNNPEFCEQSSAAKNNITVVLDKLMSLQETLLRQFPETKSISAVKTDKQKSQSSDKPMETTESDEEIPSDTEDEEIPSDTEDEATEKTQTPKPTKVTPNKKRKLEDYEKELSTTHKAFKTFRDSTIQKWNEKTRQVNLKNAPTNTILQQITYILSDKEKLVRKTQLKRSDYDIIGYKKPVVDDTDGTTENPITIERKDTDEYIPEIFDDSDFYHQLLRELIECKSADISDPVQLSRQWIALQQMRSKMKRKVDTKATKGRKIKYVVHNQLVNYMAPEKSLTWTEESTKELYSSLFGKLFEQNNVTNNENGFRIK